MPVRPRRSRRNRYALHPLEVLELFLDADDAADAERLERIIESRRVTADDYQFVTELRERLRRVEHGPPADLPADDSEKYIPGTGAYLRAGTAAMFAAAKIGTARSSPLHRGQPSGRPSPLRV